MTVQVIPIPASVKAEVSDLMQKVQALLTPYQVTITDAERKTLGSTAMGRESVPFAQQGEQLLANFPQIMPRTFTDAMIASYPVQLRAFNSADDLSVTANTVAAQLSGIKLVTGNGVMGMARAGYKNGQNDKGQTPGVKPIIDEMGKLYHHTAPVAPVPPVPPAA